MDRVNIPASVKDGSYRYKRPRPDVNFRTGKTLIKNLDAVSKALGRPSEILIKFMSIKLGCAYSGNILNGLYETERLEVLIERFIKHCVLCSEDGNPETDYFLNSGGKLLLKCRACGMLTEVEEDKINSSLAATAPKPSTKKVPIAYFPQDDEWDQDYE